MAKKSPWLCKAGAELRSAINHCFPDRDKRSDGWIGDAKHSATKSDHNPDSKTSVVRGLDIDADLDAHKSTSIYLADQLRLLAKSKRDKRIAYIIHAGRICSPILNWKWRKYRGINPHHSHIHISFTAAGDYDGSIFEGIPLLEMNGKK